MTTMKDLFLEVLDDAKKVQTFQEAVDLHEHTKLLVSDFGNKQGLYSDDDRWRLTKLRNEALTKVRDALNRARIERDVTDAVARREQWEADRKARIKAITEQLERDAHLELERTHDERRPIRGHAFEGLIGRSDRGIERER